MKGVTAADRLSCLVRAILNAVVGMLLALAWLPWAFWADAFIAAVRWALYQGRWPSYGDPYFGSVPESFGPMPGWTEWAIPLVVWISLIALSYAACRRFVPLRWWIWAGLTLVVVAWGLCFVWMLIDPGGILDWYLD